MIPYSCNCLNIRIDINDEFLLNIKDIVPDYSNLISNNIFPKESHVTYINNCNIILKNDFLTHSSQIGNWIVTVCLNCSLITHAICSNPICITNKDNIIDLNVDNKESINFIIISSALIQKEEKSEYGSDDKSYSLLFNIFLQKPNESNLSSDLTSTETMQCLQKIQARFEAYLSSEHAKIEEQIKKYEEEQRSFFEKLKEKVRIEKNAVISTFISSSKSFNLTKLTSKKNTSDLSSLPVVAATSSATQRKIVSPSRNFRHKISDVIVEESSDTEADDKINISNEGKISTNNHEQPFTESIEKIAYIGLTGNEDFPISTKLVQHDQVVEDLEDVFQIDIDEIGKQPFSGSDTTSEKSIDLDYIGEDEGMPDEHEEYSLYSSSMPIQVPLLRQGSHQSYASDSSDAFNKDDEKMAASIQALARSVVANSTKDVFGELPKSRTRIKILTSTGGSADEEQ